MMTLAETLSCTSVTRDMQVLVKIGVGEKKWEFLEGLMDVLPEFEKLRHWWKSRTLMLKSGHGSWSILI